MSDKQVIGTCSLCGGPVEQHTYLHIVGPFPPAECRTCGAKAAPNYGRVIPMEPRRKDPSIPEGVKERLRRTPFAPPPLHWLVVLMIAVTAPVFAQSSWVGVYRVDGANMDGGHYTGAVQVEAIPDSKLYMLTWSMDAKPCDGDDCMLGVGYEHDGTLVVIGQNTHMFASFKRDINDFYRTQHGLWMIPGLSEPLHEDWTRTDYKKLKDAIKPVPTHGSQREAITGVDGTCEPHEVFTRPDGTLEVHGPGCNPPVIVGDHAIVDTDGNGKVWK